MGHPDWQTYPNWRGVPLVYTNQAFPVGNTSFGLFAVQNYQSVLVEVGISSDQCSILFEFWADQAKTQIVDNYNLILNAGTLVKLILPVPANFMDVIVRNTSANPESLLISVTPVNIPASRPMFFGNTNVISQSNVNLAANGVDTFQLPFIQPGLAHWFVNPHDATGKLTFALFAGSATQQGGQVYRTDAPTAPDQRLIGLSDRAYFIQVTNNDGAAAHVFDVVLIPVG